MACKKSSETVTFSGWRASRSCCLIFNCVKLVMPSRRQLRRMAWMYFQWGLPLKTASLKAAFTISVSVWSCLTVCVKSSISKGVNKRPNSCSKVLTKSANSFSACLFCPRCATSVLLWSKSSRCSSATVASKRTSISHPAQWFDTGANLDWSGETWTGWLLWQTCQSHLQFDSAWGWIGWSYSANKRTAKPENPLRL